MIEVGSVTLYHVADHTYQLKVLGGEVASECKGMGGNLMGIGKVIRVCLVKKDIRVVFFVLVHSCEYTRFI